MATQATPKFRLSFSQEQIDLLFTGLTALRDSEEAKSLLYFKTFETLRAYVKGARQPAYVTTGEKPGRKVAEITLADLVSQEDINKVSYSTIEDCKKGFVSFHSIYKPMNFPAPADLQGACQAWLTYCTDNDLNPYKEAGLPEPTEPTETKE